MKLKQRRSLIITRVKPTGTFGILGLQEQSLALPAADLGFRRGGRSCFGLLGRCVGTVGQRLAFAYGLTAV